MPRTKSNRTGDAQAASHVANVVEQKVVRRTAQQARDLLSRSKLPPELEALARGEKRPFAKRPGPALQDPRAVANVRGVKNQDAREVFQKRLQRMQDAKTEDREQLWSEAEQLELWRAGSLGGLDALAHVVGYAPKTKTTALINEFERAAWYRAEFAFLPLEARVSVSAGRLQLNLPLSVESADALSATARLLGLLFAAPPGSGDESPKREEPSRPREDRPRSDARERGPSRNHAGRDERGPSRNQGGRDERGPSRNQGGRDARGPGSGPRGPGPRR